MQEQLDKVTEVVLGLAHAFPERIPKDSPLEHLIYELENNIRGCPGSKFESRMLQLDESSGNWQLTGKGAPKDLGNDLNNILGRFKRERWAISKMSGDEYLLVRGGP